MSQLLMSQKQMTLAETACRYPEHRFTNLYSLMHWDYWIRCAADAVTQSTATLVTITLMESRDAVKAARPVWRERWGKPQGVILEWRPCPYSTKIFV